MKHLFYSTLWRKFRAESMKTVSPKFFGMLQFPLHVNRFSPAFASKCRSVSLHLWILRDSFGLFWTCFELGSKPQDSIDYETSVQNFVLTFGFFWIHSYPNSDAFRCIFGVFWTLLDSFGLALNSAPNTKIPETAKYQ